MPLASWLSILPSLLLNPSKACLSEAPSSLLVADARPESETVKARLGYRVIGTRRRPCKTLRI